MVQFSCGVEQPLVGVASKKQYIFYTPLQRLMTPEWMATMPTLVLPPRFSEDSIILRKAAFQANWRVERLPSWRVPQGWDVLTDEIVFYGEPLFALAVADQLNIKLIEPSPHWLPELAPQWLGRNVWSTTVGEIHGLKGGPWFIKPADDKCFPARVYATVDDLAISEDVEPSTVVLVSDVVRWRDEYRCFVADHTVKACSIYALDGEVAQDSQGRWMADEEMLAEAHSFCQAFVDAQPEHIPQALVIDVGRLGDGRWAVVEANAAWGSGVYGCAPSGVLHVLQHAVINTADHIDGHPWIRPWTPI